MLQFMNMPLSSGNTIHNEINKYFSTNISEEESLDWWLQHKEVNSV